jgi:hypothetical protein
MTDIKKYDYVEALVDFTTPDGASIAKGCMYQVEDFGIPDGPCETCGDDGDTAISLFGVSSDDWFWCPHCEIKPIYRPKQELHAMTKPITLKIADVVENGREAYLAGRLSAQNPRENRIVKCLYRDDRGLPCIIGASLDDETAKCFDERPVSSVSSLVAQGLLKTDDFNTLKELQQNHDNWLAYQNGDSHQRLRQLLGL